MAKKGSLSRRKFLRQSSLAALGGTLLLAGGAPLPGRQTEKSPAPAAGKGKSRVALVRREDVLDAAGAPRPEVLLEMLDAGLCALTGLPQAAVAWKSILKPTDVLGIKTNVWPNIPTTPQLEQAIKRRAVEAGVKEESIAIDDRGVLRNPIFARSTALINARPLRTHAWSGVGTCIKNYVMFVPDPYNYHADSCASLASIWENPLVKGKTRLNILSMLTPQFHSVGPHSFNPRYVWKYHGLLLGFDVVATDATGLRILEAIRTAYFGEERPLSPPAKHIQVADAKYRLGTSDPARIELVKIGWEKDIFI